MCDTADSILMSKFSLKEQVNYFKIINYSTRFHLLYILSVKVRRWKLSSRSKTLLERKHNMRLFITIFVEVAYNHLNLYCGIVPGWHIWWYERGFWKIKSNLNITL